jgi:hypothetical protein
MTTILATALAIAIALAAGIPTTAAVVAPASSGVSDDMNGSGPPG